MVSQLLSRQERLILGLYWTWGTDIDRSQSINGVSYCGSIFWYAIIFTLCNKNAKKQLSRPTPNQGTDILFQLVRKSSDIEDISVIRKKYIFSLFWFTHVIHRVVSYLVLVWHLPLALKDSHDYLLSFSTCCRQAHFQIHFVTPTIQLQLRILLGVEGWIESRSGPALFCWSWQKQTSLHSLWNVKFLTNGCPEYLPSS